MRERDLFIEALQKDSPAARSAHLDEACAGNAELRRRVEQLLKEHARQESFILDSPPPGVEATVLTAGSERPGMQIGPYKLLQQIGEGGMGVVFMAEQTEPVERRVAVKIVKPGMDSRQVLARFDAERHALAVLDHPNIARVLDAGTTSTGRPYFVMELVKGEPITHYCDDHHLTPRERLELFIPVCEAVQHAHQKGIIHRDLKPSNVLIALYDGKPVPKVIDFGVAKATGPKLTEQTLFTEFGSIVGTLEYMSPEQADLNQLDIDTRSDIYSLGVLLYELLTGTTPLQRKEFQESAVLEMLRMIREDEPPIPSTRLTNAEELPSIAAHRGLEPKRLSGLVRGELDWIVMKCLEKERSRRYETANGLAMDVKRYLADEPVLACPPSRVYRLRKFARRNKASLVVAAVLAGSLIIGTLASTWQAMRATRAEEIAQDQRKLAEENFQKARQAVDEYFTLVSESTLLDVPGLQPLRKELLEAALRFYEKFAVERTDDPGVLADLAVTHLRVAEVYLTIDRTDDCLASLAQALDVIDRLRRDYPAATEHHRQLAGYWKGSRPAQKAGPSAPRDGPAALKLIERQVNTWQRLADENPSEIGFQSDLAAIYAHLGQLLDFERPDQAAIFSEKAERILETLVRQDPKVPEYRADLARVYETLVGTFLRLGRSADSYSAFRRSLELNEQLAADFPNVPQYRVDLTINLRSLARRSDTQQPVPVFRRAIDQAKGLVTEFPAVPLYRSLLTGIANDLLTLVRQPGQHQQEAERLFRELMADVTQFAAENPEQAGQLWQSATAFNYMELGKLLDKGGQPQEAEKAFRQGIGLLEKLVTDSPDDRAPRGHDYRLLGFHLHQTGRLPEAEWAFRKALAVFDKLATDYPSEPENQHFLADTHRCLGVVLAASQRSEEAEKAYRQAVDIHEARAAQFPGKPVNEAEVAASYSDLAGLLSATGRQKEAKDFYRKALKLNPNNHGMLHAYALFLHGTGLHAEAENTYRETLAGYRRAHGDKHAEVARCLYDLARVLSDQAKYEEAETMCREALAVRRQVHGETDSRVARDLELLAVLVHKSNKPLPEVEQAYRDSQAVWSKLVTDFPKNLDYQLQLAHSHHDLANILRAAGRHQDAEQLLRQAIDAYSKLSAAQPKEFGLRQELVQRHAELAGLLKQAGRIEDAEAVVAELMRVQDRLEADFSDQPDRRRELASGQFQVGNLLREAGHNREAEILLRRAIEHYRKLVADIRTSPDDRNGFASAHYYLAVVLYTTNRVPEALTAFQQAIETWEELTKDVPGNPEYSSYLAVSYTMKGGLLTQAGQLQEAEKLYRRVAEIPERLPVKFPATPVHRHNLADSRYRLATVLKATGRSQEAEAAYREAGAIWKQLVADFPKEPGYRTQLSGSYAELVELLLQQGKHADASKLAVELPQVYPDKWEEYQRSAGYLEQCAAGAQKDASLSPSDRKAAVEAYAKQAAELLSDAVKRVTGNSALENQLAWTLATNPNPELRSPARAVELARKAVEGQPSAGNYWNTLGVAQYRAGNWKDALAALQKSMELRGGSDSFDWFFLAMIHWQLGDKDRAGKWYEAGRLWMARHAVDNGELLRFRAEAAALLGRPEDVSTEKIDDLAVAQALFDANPEAPSSYHYRGATHAELGQWDRAAEDLAKAIELGEQGFRVWYERALVCLAREDKEGFRAACAELLKQFAQTNDASTAYFTAWTCALAPDALADLAPASALAEKAVQANPKSVQHGNALGAILCRAGRYEESVRKLQEADLLAQKAGANDSSPAYTWFFLAMAHYHLGHHVEAAAGLTRACNLSDTALKDLEAGKSKLAWNRRLTLTLLRKEAETLIGKEQTPVPQSQNQGTKPE